VFAVCYLSTAVPSVLVEIIAHSSNIADFRERDTTVFAIFLSSRSNVAHKNTMQAILTTGNVLRSRSSQPQCEAAMNEPDIVTAMVFVSTIAITLLICILLACVAWVALT